MLEESIKDIINNYDDFFYAKKNVLGIALGYKYIKNMNTNVPSLHILVKNKIIANNIYKQDLIPKTFLGVKTDVIECGEINTFNDNNYKLTSNTKALTSKIRPIEGGYSIGPLFHKHSGTLGCIVFDNYRNEPHILSNNHVLSYFNKMPKGTFILQPSLKDYKYNILNAVAILTKFIPLKFKKSDYDLTNKNLVDCAIAKLLPGVSYTKNIYKIGPILKDTTAKLETYVQKSGRTTGYTIGKIISLNASLNIDHNNLSMNFKNLIITTKICEAGDSGAILLDFSNRAIGIVMGSSGLTSFIVPIEPVLKLLDIHF